MPPKVLSIPFVLKGDRIKVSFKNLTTKENAHWEGDVIQVDPLLCVFPNDMPGNLAGIPIPSPSQNIKTTKIVVIKPNKDKKSHQVPLPVPSTVEDIAPVLVRIPKSGEWITVPKSDAAVIKDGFKKFVAEPGAPEEISFMVGWVEIKVNFKTMHATQISKQHIKIQ